LRFSLCLWIIRICLCFLCV